MLLSGLLREKKDGVMCKVSIIGQWVVCFEEVKVVRAEGGGGEVGEEWERKREKMEREEKEKIGVKKGKWGNRWLSVLVLEQNGEGN
jgi:hypothetical protein